MSQATGDLDPCDTGSCLWRRDSPSEPWQLDSDSCPNNCECESHMDMRSSPSKLATVEPSNIAITACRPNNNCDGIHCRTIRWEGRVTVTSDFKNIPHVTCTLTNEAGDRTSWEYYSRLSFDKDHLHGHLEPLKPALGTVLIFRVDDETSDVLELIDAGILRKIGEKDCGCAELARLKQENAELKNAIATFFIKQQLAEVKSQ